MAKTVSKKDEVKKTVSKKDESKMSFPEPSLQFQNMDKERQKEIASMGGKVSAEKKRKRKQIAEFASMIANSPVSDVKKRQKLKEIGIETEEATNNALVVAGLFASCEKGNVDAFKEWERILAEQEAKENTAKYPELSAYEVVSSFVDVNRYIRRRKYKEFFFIGGRGSGKSTNIADVIVDDILQNSHTNWMIMRKVKDTLRTSVFEQILSAIDKLNVTELFKINKTSMDITFLPTGQRIMFRGADDTKKIKSIKLRKGYFTGLWIEECDAFNDNDEIEDIKRSVLRGTDEKGESDGILLKSSNAPRSFLHWVNEWLVENINKPNLFIHRSSYLTMPEEFIGKLFIEDAEYLKLTNEKAYRHQYLAEPISSDEMIFDNIELRTITDDEYNAFIDNETDLYAGLDYGWYPDPNAYTFMHYDRYANILYILNEWQGLKHTEEMTSDELDKLSDRVDFRRYRITSDKDENRTKNISDLGWQIYCANKGPGSVNSGFTFLQGLTKIVIDSSRTPNCAREFTKFHYEKNKYGQIMGTFPDGQEDHHMASIRYALEVIWQRIKR